MTNKDFKTLKIGELVAPIGRSKDYGRTYIVIAKSGNDIIVEPADKLPPTKVVISETSQTLGNERQRGYKYQAMKRLGI